MESYYDNWKDTNNGKPGAKMGFTTTAGKRKKEFEKYVGRIGDSRLTENSKLWSDRLLVVAQQELMRKKEHNDDDSTVDSAEDVSEASKTKDQNYLKYTANALGESSCDEEDDMDEETTSAIEEV
jgi:hypothetical protein